MRTLLLEKNSPKSEEEKIMVNDIFNKKLIAIIYSDGAVFSDRKLIKLEFDQINVIANNFHLFYNNIK